ncbi:Lysine-specific demethylase jmj32 [Asimina triloba]
MGGNEWVEEETEAGCSHGIAGLWKEVRELSLGLATSIDRLHQPPSPLHFLKNYVSPNKPCIISNAIRHWPAFSTWPNPNHLLAHSDHLVSVHLTPHGRADALVPHPLHPSSSALCFASAHVQSMPFPLALHHIASPPFPNYVPYAQDQNDCFRSQYSFLAPDVDAHIPWATEAFGCLPEAVNLWIGSHRSETSFHKDHYENMYAVVSGEKHFLLLPPTDVHRMYIRRYPAARYSFSQETGEFSLELESPPRYVPWCSVNPYPSSPSEAEQQMSSFPLYFNGPKPFECTVKAGEILYL